MENEVQYPDWAPTVGEAKERLDELQAHVEEIAKKFPDFNVSMHLQHPKKVITYSSFLEEEKISRKVRVTDHNLPPHVDCACCWDKDDSEHLGFVPDPEFLSAVLPIIRQKELEEKVRLN